MTLDASTFADAALGFRAWQVTYDGLLRSTGVGKEVWRPGVNVAYCDRPQAHTPAGDCTCGLYAYHELSRAASLSQGYDLNRNLGPYLVGAVAFRGHAEISETGLRGEEAVIVALAFVPDAQLSDDDERRMWQAADRYGVPVVAFEQLESFAQRARTLHRQRHLLLTAAAAGMFLTVLAGMLGLMSLVAAPMVMSAVAAVGLVVVTLLEGRLFSRSPRLREEESFT